MLFVLLIRKMSVSLNTPHPLASILAIGITAFLHGNGYGIVIAVLRKSSSKISNGFCGT